MLKNKRKAFSFAEVMIVLAISSGLLVIATLTFSGRSRVQSDEAARLLMQEIRTVRNSAQQGQGPQNGVVPAGSELSGSELFGQAIVFKNEQEGLEVRKLAVKGGTISAYETYSISTNGLKFNLYNDNSGFKSCILPSCNSPLTQNPSSSVALVIRDGTGESYFFQNESEISEPAKYTPTNQKRFQLAMYNSTDGGLNQSRFKYYAIFNTPVPNEQELKVYP